MKKQKTYSVKFNFLCNIITQLVLYLSPLVISPYVSRVLLPAGIGEYSYAYSIVSYFVRVIAFGFINYGNQQISSARDDKQTYSNIFWSIFITRSILFILTASIFFVLTFLNAFGELAGRNVFLSRSTFVFASFLDISFLFQGLENFKIISITNSFCKLLSIGFVFLFVKEQSDLPIYCLINGGYRFFTASLQWFFAFKHLVKPQKAALHIIKTFKESFVFFVPTVAISIYTIIDKTMIGSIAGSAETGYYEQASKIYQVVASLISAIYPIMISRITYLYKHGQKEEIQKKFVQLGNVHGWIAFPCIFGLYSISKYFLPLFFGDSFTPCIRVIYFLLPLIYISTISGALLSAYFIPMNKVNQASIVYFCGAIINFTLNLVFIRYWKAEGAARTSLIAETIISLSMILLTRTEIPYFKILRDDLKPLISSLIRFSLLRILNEFAYPESRPSLTICILDILIGAVTYGVVSILIKDKTTRLAISFLKSRFHH